MDEDSYEIIKFSTLNLAFIADLSNMINSLSYDSVLMRYKINKIENKPLLKELEIYPKLIKKLKFFKNWLKKNKKEIVENETKNLIDFLEKTIKEFENLSENDKKSYMYSYKFIRPTLMNHLSLINQKIYRLISGIKTY